MTGARGGTPEGQEQWRGAAVTAEFLGAVGGRSIGRQMGHREAHSQQEEQPRVQAPARERVHALQQGRLQRADVHRALARAT